VRCRQPRTHRGRRRCRGRPRLVLGTPLRRWATSRLYRGRRGRLSRCRGSTPHGRGCRGRAINRGCHRHLWLVHVWPVHVPRLNGLSPPRRRRCDDLRRNGGGDRDGRCRCGCGDRRRLRGRRELRRGGRRRLRGRRGLRRGGRRRLRGRGLRRGRRGRVRGRCGLRRGRNRVDRIRRHGNRRRGRRRGGRRRRPRREEGHRVEVAVVVTRQADAEMHVGHVQLGRSRRSHEADGRSLLHARARPHRQRGEMRQ
jgi:hypothetical protein